jgi:hypothetical protein
MAKSNVVRLFDDVEIQADVFGREFITSNELARLSGREHFIVLRDLRSLVDKMEDRHKYNFVLVKSKAGGRLSHIEITEKGYIGVAGNFDPNMGMRVADAFDAMRAELRMRAPESKAVAQADEVFAAVAARFERANSGPREEEHDEPVAANDRHAIDNIQAIVQAIGAEVRSALREFKDGGAIQEILQAVIGFKTQSKVDRDVYATRDEMQTLVYLVLLALTRIDQFDDTQVELTKAMDAWNEHFSQRLKELTEAGSDSNAAFLGAVLDALLMLKDQLIEAMRNAHGEQSHFTIRVAKCTVDEMVKRFEHLRIKTVQKHDAP